MQNYIAKHVWAILKIRHCLVELDLIKKLNCVMTRKFLFNFNKLVLSNLYCPNIK